MLNFDPTALASNLEPGPGGLWFAKNRSQVSYPEEGNLNCLALEEDSFWFEHRNACILALLRRYPPPGVLLDVGGGNGYVTLGLQRGGIAAALLEPGEQGARNAVRRGVAPVICSTLEDAGFAPGSLPAVGLFDVLEHIRDDVAFLRTLAGLLQPGGRLYLTVPAYSLLWSADDDYSGHFRRYTLPALRAALQSAGLVPNFATYFFFMLPLPIFLLRAVPTRLGLRKTNAWDSYRQEHSSRPGWTGRLLNQLLNWERAALSQGRTIPLGGSCLVAAQKV